MDRRRYLRLGTGLFAAGALSGCVSDTLGGEESTTDGATSTVGSPGGEQSAQRGVYVQSFTEGMYVVGMGGMGGMDESGGMNGSGNGSGMNGSGGMEMSGSGNTSNMSDSDSMDDRGTESMPVAGNYQFALMYAAPHVFWNVNGTEVNRTPIGEGDSLHLMSVVWDPKTRTVLPETGLSVEVMKDGELVSEEVIYPMLSQRMGFHYGGNFALAGDGTYTAKLSVGGMSVRRTGAFEGRFGKPASVEIEFPFTQQTREQVTSPKAQRAGEPGAVKPMQMGMMPPAFAPTKAELPGSFVAQGKSGDAVFLVTELGPQESPLEDGGSYLAVSARTPYNRLLLPAMALSATVERGGKTVFDGPLKRTLDPALNYHYGAAIDGLQSGDALTISVGTPPQVARHEGYETAFLDMPDMNLTA